MCPRVTCSLVKIYHMHKLWKQQRVETVFGTDIILTIMCSPGGPSVVAKPNQLPDAAAVEKYGVAPIIHAYAFFIRFFIFNI